MVNINCECCKKEVENYGNRKLCNSCSLYTKELRRKASYFKCKFRRLNKEKYGTVSGSERIRFST